MNSPHRQANFLDALPVPTRHPPRGIVLDMFCGSGSTGKAAELEGFNFVGIDLEEGNKELSEKRIDAVKLPLFEAMK